MINLPYPYEYSELWGTFTERERDVFLAIADLCDKTAGDDVLSLVAKIADWRIAEASKPKSSDYAC